MVGIKETKEAVAFGLDVGLALGLSFADDGKLTGADVAKFFPAVMEFPAAIEGAGQIPAEIKDLDSAELEELKAFVIEKAKTIPGVKEKWLKIAVGSFQIAQGALTIIAAVRSN